MDLEELETSLGAEYKPFERKRVIPGNWRLLRNAGKTDIEPGYDDLQKICKFIKKGAHDCEIMEAFGINALTMQSIKEGRYCPVYGIKHSTLTKIQNEFINHEKQIEMLLQTVSELLDIVFINPEHHKEFIAKTKFKKSSSTKKSKRKKSLAAIAAAGAVADDVEIDDFEDDEEECCE